MKADRSLILKTLLPLVIGVAVVAWLFGREFSLADLERIPWSGRAVWALSLALLAVAGREFGLAWRFRILTDGRLSPMAALRVTMMCEFTSAITPTTAGGSAMSVWFMHRERQQRLEYQAAVGFHGLLMEFRLKIAAGI